jgi:hypothetical protein
MSKPLKTISLLCPTRGRPDKALRLVLSVLQTAHHPERVEVLFYVDTDDSTKLDYVSQLEAHKAELSQLAFLRHGMLWQLLPKEICW